MPVTVTITIKHCAETDMMRVASAFVEGCQEFATELFVDAVWLLGSQLLWFPRPHPVDAVRVGGGVERCVK